ncbi:Uncharacterised protein [Mycobacterium tuberculosis]|uniref:Uncharacterized protein n=1 Tax=Mycobacterium tuberculosis TaxID=1773 RepID=A0A654ZI14_MYCTX|nr:Uncharacterised protein [Mycobacterium tuberculosis]CKQ06972.1 Uncharacterised protein [Mycobacterium tuberculosis]CKS40001.1 Uncharacterised protein [Mycobacterium tuberculosis]CNV07830.1 Uncharacterised protein [Mycobacterium tuberculosis]CNV29846.1 Uncharacterised protein [Mycobacterium tuberculosis]
MNGGGVGVDRRDIARTTIRARPGDAQASTLPDGEPVHPIMGSQHHTIRVNHHTTANPDALTQKSLGVPGRYEADVVAIRLVGDRQAAAGRLGTDLPLRRVADRERGVAQLLRSEHGKHIRLILVPVDGAAQPPTRQPGVVAGGHRIETQRHSPGGQSSELDLLIAPHARVRSFPAGIRRHEVVDHVLFELLCEIPNIKRDSEHIGDAARVCSVLFGTTAPRAGAQRAGRGR